MINFNLKFENTINHFLNEIPFTPDIAIVLGSGLGSFVNSTKIIRTFNCDEIPGYPPSTIIGHAGKIHFVNVGGKNALIFQGRIHFYEGYKLAECLLPVYLAYKTGVKNILLTNAAGGVNKAFFPGDLMINTSFNGLNIKKLFMEVIQNAGVEGINNFINIPSKDLNDKIKYAAQELKIDIREGIYWYTKGPNYETPAEVRMISEYGGDAVGMSTVHEAYFAGYLGLNVSSISCITNYAAGISEQKLSHSEVTQTAKIVEDKFSKLITNFVSRI